MAAEPFAIDLIKGVAALILLPVLLTFTVVAIRLLRAYLTDRSEYERNKARSPSLRAVVRGEAPTFFDGVRDERVAAGIARDVKRNTWVEQGKLSEEAVSNVLN
jgi:hypothetical protein